MCVHRTAFPYNADNHPSNLPLSNSIEKFHRKNARSKGVLPGNRLKQLPPLNFNRDKFYGPQKTKILNRQTKKYFFTTHLIYSVLISIEIKLMSIKYNLIPI